MPSPVGHALGGLIVALLFEGRGGQTTRQDPGGVRQRGGTDLRWLCVAAACLPDIDFGWGRHNMETHSIGFALLLGLAVLAWRRSPVVAASCGVAAGTHVLFDWLGSDDSPPLGVMALWPFSSSFYFADAFVFEAISRRYWLPGFVLHNALAVARELAILVPVVLAMMVLRRRRR